jgi:hypothetical protein
MALLDGAPARAGRGAVESAWTRWLGLPDFTTAAVAASAGAGGGTVAAGLSRTGPGEAGWASAGLALGAAGRDFGASLRALARRDVAGGSDAAVGGEAGGTLWLRAAAVMAWARAPQLWSGGEGPPLPRPLAVGVAWGDAGLGLWFERSAPSRPEDTAGRHLAGVSLASGPVTVWIEARDGPLRSGVGLAARAGAVAVAARVDAHPELGETVSVSLAVGGAP